MHYVPSGVGPTPVTPAETSQKTPLQVCGLSKIAARRLRPPSNTDKAHQVASLSSCGTLPPCTTQTLHSANCRPVCARFAASQHAATGALATASVRRDGPTFQFGVDFGNVTGAPMSATLA